MVGCAIVVDGEEYDSPDAVAVGYRYLAQSIASRAAAINRAARNWKDDLFSVAWEGVLKAARRWDGSTPFRPYATIVASREVIHFVRTVVMRASGIQGIPGLSSNRGWKYHNIPIAHGENALRFLLDRPNPVRPEQVEELVTYARRVMGDTKKYHVFRLRIGGHTLNQIAKELGFRSRQAADMSYRQAIKELREAAKASGCDFLL